MVRKSDHYAMAVQYITQEIPPELSKTASKVVVGIQILRPCSRVFAFVLSTKRSQASAAGATGHKRVIDGVAGFFPASSGDTEKIQSHFLLHS